MKKLSVVLTFLILVGGVSAFGQSNVANQTINFLIDEVALIEVSGVIITMHITQADWTPGGIGQVMDVTTTYSVITNSAATKKITASLDADMPADTTLLLNLAAGPVGASLGDVTLNTVPQDLVNGITPTSYSGAQITYTFQCTADANPILVAQSRVVTLTLTDDV